MEQLNADVTYRKTPCGIGYWKAECMVWPMGVTIAAVDDDPVAAKNRVIAAVRQANVLNPIEWVER